MNISLKNLYVDIEAQRVNPSSLDRISSWRLWVSILGAGPVLRVLK